MKAVGRENTGPELRVRKALYGLGYRYRLHDKRLPGCPDVVFMRRRKAIFVHGCFWHGHNCRPSLRPASRQSFWDAKIARNRSRDEESIARLEHLEWDVLVIWECETTAKCLPDLQAKLRTFLGPPGATQKRAR